MHQWAVEGDDLLRFGELVVDFTVYIVKLFNFMLFANKGFDYPNGADVFLDYRVHPIVGFEHLREDRVGKANEEEEAKGQRRNGDEEHQT